MKIIGIGKNYVNETSEIDAIKTGNQLIFTKPDSSLVTGNKDVPYPKITNEIVYEVELVAKIGKTAKDIAVTDAPSYIAK
ncbi:2-hydroxyhepta-2,4-diene-1,7-dioate isomerase [Jejuia pallidilutea]|uniref:2-hydroxyhepta-2,4-diene-1,7-dioate isomerase n=1 Tax=Jejuia pallidilutea TaxID=504487 RepID=A0A090VW94_9FLAO|nr:fumarylacetoacetate hydrolase family protein [Jejuia pallidilutea]GAL68976.1 2-hydroxyhepta-2,4-diene-1,7-dioate isomerase [Jejuia pallidilutea]